MEDFWKFPKVSFNKPFKKIYSSSNDIQTQLNKKSKNLFETCKSLTDDVELIEHSMKTFFSKFGTHLFIILWFI